MTLGKGENAHASSIAGEVGQATALVPKLGQLVLLAIGFGCMVGYSRMLSLGFVGYLSQGVYESSDAWYGLRMAACLITLAVLAFGGWYRRLKIGVPALLLATAGAVTAPVVFAVDAAGQFGWAVAAVGGVCMAVLMFVWMLTLSRFDVRSIAIVGLAGLAVSGLFIMGVPYVDSALALMAAVVSAFLAGALALLANRNVDCLAPDGPLRGSQAARIPWITVVMVLLCGFLATVVYGIAQHLTWLYDWAPNYAVFGVAIVAVLVFTFGIIVRSKRWMHFVWAPQFVLLVLALLFSCFSVRESIQMAVGLLLAAVFCAHFLHWVIFPALFSALRIPRSFMAGIVLICANGSLTTALGDALGGLLPHSMQNLGGVAGVTVIVLALAFAVTFAVYRHAFGTVGLLAALAPLPQRQDASAHSRVSSRAELDTDASVARGDASAVALDGDSSSDAQSDASNRMAPHSGSEDGAIGGSASGLDVPIGLEAASDDGTPDVSAANAPAPNPLDMLQARVDALVPSYGLTPREQEVTFLTVQGFSCGYIAEKLVVSESTVRFHQKNLYRKLDVHSRNELIEFVNNTAS